MSTDPDPWAEIKAECRKSWGRVTPFRLGIAAAARSVTLDCPYTSMRSREQFFRGSAWFLHLQQERELAMSL